MVVVEVEVEVVVEAADVKSASRIMKKRVPLPSFFGKGIKQGSFSQNLKKCYSQKGRNIESSRKAELKVLLTEEAQLPLVHLV